MSSEIIKNCIIWAANDPYHNIIINASEFKLYDNGIQLFNGDHEDLYVTDIFTDSADEATVDRIILNQDVKSTPYLEVAYTMMQYVSDYIGVWIDISGNQMDVHGEDELLATIHEEEDGRVILDSKPFKNTDDYGFVLKYLRGLDMLEVKS